MTDVMAGHEPGSEPGSGPEGTPEGTRERILAEAIDMFLRHGYHRTTLRTLADRLGITKAAILYHFPAKDRILVALMAPFIDAIEAAIDRAAAMSYPERRWALLDGLLDTYFQHQKLLNMARVDAAIFSQEETYRRFMLVTGRVVEVIVGPDAPLEDKVWAVQLLGTLGDSLLFFNDHPPARLRAALQQGTLRLLAGGPPSLAPKIDWVVPMPGNPITRVLAPAAAPRVTTNRSPGGGRRVGRPRVLSGDRIKRARDMYASGTHNVDAIAAELGVSRATVYRYLN